MNKLFFGHILHFKIGQEFHHYWRKCLKCNNEIYSYINSPYYFIEKEVTSTLSYKRFDLTCEELMIKQIIE